MGGGCWAHGVDWGEGGAARREGQAKAGSPVLLQLSLELRSPHVLTALGWVRPPRTHPDCPLPQRVPARGAAVHQPGLSR